MKTCRWREGDLHCALIDLRGSHHDDQTDVPLLGRIDTHSCFRDAITFDVDRWAPGTHRAGLTNDKPP